MVAGANGEVVIIVAGEDQSGAVMQAVEANLARVQARATSAGREMVMAGEHAVPAMAAASASVRVLDGDFSHMMRAEERFLSSLPGISSLMQAAFPVIGLFAVVEGLTKAGEAAYDFIQRNREMGATITRAFGDADIAVQKSNDSLRVSNDRLENEIAKLERRPGNGLKLALDEARLSADELAESLTKDNDRLAALLKQNSVSRVGGFFTLQAPTGEAADLFKSYQTQANDLAIAGEQRARTAKTADEAQAIRTQTQSQLYALQGRTLDEITKKIADIGRAKAQQERDAADNPEGFQALPNQDALVASYKGIQQSIGQQMDTIQLRSSQEALEKQKEIAEAKHQQGEIDTQNARRAEEERRKQDEWLSRVEKSGVGSSQTAVYAQQKATQELLEKSHEESLRMADQEAEAWVKAEEQKAAAAVKASQREIQAAREAQEARIRMAGEQYKGVDEDTAFGVKQGTLSESARVQALRKAAADEYAIKQNAMEQIRELDAIDPDNPEKVQRDQDQILQLKQQYSRQMISLDQQEAEKRREVQTGLLRDVLNPLMEGSKTVAQRFKDMADSIISDLERIAEQKAIEGILRSLNGGAAGGGAAGAQPTGGGGIGGILGGLLGSLIGGGKTKASNGGLATGAGTTPDAITSGLKQGNGSGGGGVQVTIINQGTPQTVASSGSTGGGFEQMVISLVMKDADTLGPMSQALGGAIGML